MATCAGGPTARHALRSGPAHQSCEGSSEPRSGRDQAALHAALDSSVRCRGMRRRRRHQEGADESIRLSFLHTDYLGETFSQTVAKIFLKTLFFLSAAFRLSLRASRPPLEGVGLSELSPRERNKAVAGHVGISVAERPVFLGTGQAASEATCQPGRLAAIGRSVYQRRDGSAPRVADQHVNLLGDDEARR